MRHPNQEPPFQQGVLNGRGMVFIDSPDRIHLIDDMRFFELHYKVQMILYPMMSARYSTYKRLILPFN